MSESATGGLYRQHIRTVLAGRVVVAVFTLLTAPLVVGSLDGRFLMPLAYPGYLVMMVGSSIVTDLFSDLVI